MRFLITGVSGYIGFHLAKRLRNSFPESKIIGVDALFNKNTEKLHIDEFVSCDLSKGTRELRRQKFDAIFHLAALASVEESTKKPKQYYLNNILSTVNALDIDAAKFIFASTGAAFTPSNPYAFSKIACEDIVRKMPCTNRTIFRFYNVSGMDSDYTMISEPTHLIRRAALAAVNSTKLTIFGSDWNTKDGTTIRDYIHVNDISDSMINAFKRGSSEKAYECLGTSKGFTTKEVVDTMKRVSGIDLKVEYGPRRAGDFETSICDDQYAHIVLKNTLEDMCLSTFNAIKKNESSSN